MNDNTDFFYVTRRGENLLGIAHRELGDERRWQEIRALNAGDFEKTMIPSTEFDPGVVLKMPPRAGWNAGQTP